MAPNYNDSEIGGCRKMLRAILGTRKIVKDVTSLFVTGRRTFSYRKEIDLKLRNA